jgi:hypothetical protein
LELRNSTGEIEVFGGDCVKNEKKRQKVACASCECCDYLDPIGEGDHICDKADYPKIVLADYLPTDDYLWCGGKHFVEK